VSVELALAVAGCVAALSLLVAVLALTRVHALGREVEELREVALVPPSRAPADELRAPGADTGRAAASGTTSGTADQPAAGDGDQPEPYVITRLGEHGVEADAAHMEPRTFVDILAKESLVKSAGLAHGLRRALDPATRHRIRFEMRREVKRSKRDRKAEMKQAWREYQARQRAEVRLDEGDVA
jgi:hypothetical protein